MPKRAYGKPSTGGAARRRETPRNLTPSVKEASAEKISNFEAARKRINVGVGRARGSDDPVTWARHKRPRGQRKPANPDVNRIRVMRGCYLPTSPGHAGHGEADR